MIQLINKKSLSKNGKENDNKIERKLIKLQFFLLFYKINKKFELLQNIFNLNLKKIIFNFFIN